MLLVAAVPIGLLVGAVVGTVGGGGAILALPALVYLLDQGVNPATTASLIVVAMGAAAGARAHAGSGRLCVRVALAFSIPAAMGAYLGTVASLSVDPQLLVLAFVPVMLGAAAFTYMRATSADSDDHDVDCPRPAFHRTGSAGTGVGFMTGFFGVGGGFLIVPALTGLLGFSMRQAVATSLMIISLTGVAALISHLAEGARPDWALTGVLCASAIAGGRLGGQAGRSIPGATLAKAFALVVAAVAALLLIDVLVLGGPPV